MNTGIIHVVFLYGLFILHCQQVPELRAVRKMGDKFADKYTAAAVVAREVFARLSQRLDYLAVDPKVVLDLGCGVASSLPLLTKRYKKTAIVGLDISMGMLKQTRREKSFFSKPILLQANASALPLIDESCDIVVSNLMLPQCACAIEVFKEVNRVLKPGGAFLFSSLGPDSFATITDVQNQVDPENIRSKLPDMHDLGDAMAAAGLAQPVLDVEFLNINYKSVEEMLQEIRICGATNLATGRRRGLLSRSIFKAIISNLKDLPQSGFALEIIQGHSWKGGSQNLFSSIDSSAYSKRKIFPISPQ